MWPFKQKTLKKQVEEMARETFAVDIFELLSNTPANAGSPTLVNGLELFAVLFYGCDRALAVLGNTEQQQSARDYITSHLLSDISSEYSSDEMINLVLPLLEKRFSKYDGLLNKDGDPGLRLLQCANSMLENILVGIAAHRRTCAGYE